MSAACKFRPLDMRFVWSFVRSGAFPLHLGHAKAFGIQHRKPYGPCTDVPIQRAHARVQCREMQGLTLTQMAGLMREMSRFALKLVMNFKILRVIHRRRPVWRAERRSEIEYFLYVPDSLIAACIGAAVTSFRDRYRLGDTSRPRIEKRSLPEKSRLRGLQSD